MKKVLILSGSPRKGGNSDILCDQFAKGQRKQAIRWKRSALPIKKSLHAMRVTIVVGMKGNA